MDMKKFIALAAIGATLALGTNSAQAQSREERAQAELAEMLEGRVAGEAQSCINTVRNTRLRVMPYVGLVYNDGDTIWVARATRPNQLRNSDVPIMHRYGSRLCKNDVMRTIDRFSNQTRGVLFLEDFVPYTKVEEGEG
jgi:hypothetical protein